MRVLLMGYVSVLSKCLGLKDEDVFNLLYYVLKPEKSGEPLTKNKYITGERSLPSSKETGWPGVKHAQLLSFKDEKGNEEFFGRFPYSNYLYCFKKHFGFPENSDERKDFEEKRKGFLGTAFILEAIVQSNDDTKKMISDDDENCDNLASWLSITKLLRLKDGETPESKIDSPGIDDCLAKCLLTHLMYMCTQENKQAEECRKEYKMRCAGILLEHEKVLRWSKAKLDLHVRKCISDCFSSDRDRPVSTDEPPEDEPDNEFTLEAQHPLSDQAGEESCEGERLCHETNDMPPKNSIIEHELDNDFNRKASVDSGALDIVPTELLGREEELNELGELCKSDSGYFAFRGEAYSGKSALLSWFFMHPPANVWITGFFIVGYVHSRSTSDYFLEATQRQLFRLCEEPYQDSFDLTELLKKTAAKASKKGKKLVLIVDGLDEDKSEEREKWSILSRIPKEEIPNLIVILSCRYVPSLPEDLRLGDIHCTEIDVKQSKFLKDCKNKIAEELEAFKKADDSTGRDVISLLAYAGGPLTEKDLLDIIRKKRQPEELYPYQVTDIFKKSTSRTFRAVSQKSTPLSSDNSKAFTFAHKDIAEMAAQDFLDANNMRNEQLIDEWCDSYSRLGWPKGTPIYLLTDYLDLLANGSRWGRLAQLLANNYFIDHILKKMWSNSNYIRLFDAVLAELATENADLVLIGSLSCQKSRLVSFNSCIPEELPVVIAHLGDIESAREILNSAFGREPIDSNREKHTMKIKCEAEIVRLFIEQGKFSEAVTLSESIIDAIFEICPYYTQYDYTAPILDICIKSLIKSGHIEAARDAYLRIQNAWKLEPEVQSPVSHGLSAQKLTKPSTWREPFDITRVIETQAAAGDVSGALSEAEELPNDYSVRARALSKIAVVLARANCAEEAQEAIRSALKSNANKCPDVIRRAVEALYWLDNRKEADSLCNEHFSGDHLSQCIVDVAIATILVEKKESGEAVARITSAKKHFDEINFDAWMNVYGGNRSILEMIITAEASLSKIEDAFETLNNRCDNYYESYLRIAISILKTLHETGNRVFDRIKIFEAINSYDYFNDCSIAYTSLFDYAIDIYGIHDDAINKIDSTADEDVKASCLVRVAIGLISKGDKEEASALVERFFSIISQKPQILPFDCLVPLLRNGDYNTPLAYANLFEGTTYQSLILLMIAEAKIEAGLFSEAKDLIRRVESYKHRIYYDGQWPIREASHQTQSFRYTIHEPNYEIEDSRDVSLREQRFRLRILATHIIGIAAHLLDAGQKNGAVEALDLFNIQLDYIWNEDDFKYVYILALATDFQRVNVMIRASKSNLAAALAWLSRAYLKQGNSKVAKELAAESIRSLLFVDDAPIGYLPYRLVFKVMVEVSILDAFDDMVSNPKHFFATGDDLEKSLSYHGAALRKRYGEKSILQRPIETMDFKHWEPFVYIYKAYEKCVGQQHEHDCGADALTVLAQKVFDLMCDMAHCIWYVSYEYLSCIASKVFANSEPEFIARYSDKLISNFRKAVDTADEYDRPKLHGEVFCILIRHLFQIGAENRKIESLVNEYRGLNIWRLGSAFEEFDTILQLVERHPENRSYLCFLQQLLSERFRMDNQRLRSAVEMLNKASIDFDLGRDFLISLLEKAPWYEHSEFLAYVDYEAFRSLIWKQIEYHKHATKI